MRIALMSCAILLVAAPARSKDAGALPDDIASRIVEREHAVAKELAHFHPIVETYVQVMKSSQGELAPWYDQHFVSLAEFAGGLRALRFEPRNSEVWRDVKEVSESFNPKILQYDPSGFVAMAYPDPSTFDLQHYRFQFLNEEFLGETRCKVFQVTPSTLRRQGLFEGKIWVEDQNMTIIRFNGIYKGSNIAAKYFHFDSRRVSTKPGLWLPSTIDSEEPQLPCCGLWKLNWTKIHVKTRTTFWGYDLRYPGSREELTSVAFDRESSIRDLSNSSNALGPLDQKRLWDRQAEDNVTAHLEHIGLLSPSGDVEKTLGAIVQRIEDANNLSPGSEVRCRILLTSNLESAVVGHTIILSRGLLDVAPDEAVLAAILAHDLAHITLGDSNASNFAWPDQTRFGPRDVARRLHFAYSPEQESQASVRASEWLRNSSYRGSLESVAQFAAELKRQSPHVGKLLEASIGESLAVTLAVDHLPAAASRAQDVTAVSAFPLGSRIRIDPWSSEATFAQPEGDELSAKNANIRFEPSLPVRSALFLQSQTSPLYAWARPR
jgi:hypothetical protein